MRINHHLPISLSALILALVLAFPLATALAQDAPVGVRIAPETTTVASGQTIDIAIDLANARDLYGADVSLTFDPAIIQIEDADPSLDGVQVALGAFLDPGFVLRNIVDNEAGTIRFAMTQLNPSTPKSGSGTLIVLHVRGVSSGQTSPLTITRAELAQPSGVKLPSTTASGQVKVVNTVTGPTATPIPTQGGGTPLPTAAATATPGPATSTLIPSPVPPTATSVVLAASETQSSPTALPTATPSTSVPPTALPSPAVMVESTAAPSAPEPVEQETVAATSSTDAPPSPPTEPSGQTAAAESNEVPPSTESSLPEDTAETVAQAPTPTSVLLNQAEGSQAQTVRNIESSASAPERNSTSTFLIAGLALLGLAAVIAIAMLFIWRR